MTETSRFERRLAALIDEYADRAPMSVDPVATARLAAASGRAAMLPMFGARVPRLGLTFGILALTIALIGAVLFAGALAFRRDQTWVPVEGVPPFLGLAPEGAASSVPETGELLLTFGARIPALGMDAIGTLLYADGRLIWHRNLEGDLHLEMFGPFEPTTAVIEQRLTPEGIELIRAYVLASRARYPGNGYPPGTRPWGGMRLNLDGRLEDIWWSDPALPARMADPGSWLPETAWADREVRGYVPSRYAFCLGYAELGELPQPARDVLGETAPTTHRSAGDCYEVAAADARAIAASLDAAHFERCEPDPNQSYKTPTNPFDACAYDGPLYDGPTFNELLPDGEMLLHGGG